MKKQLVLGVLISAVFLYFSLRGLDFASVADGFRSLRYIYLLPVLFFLILLQVARSYRWGVILSPIEKVDQFSLFSITSVGLLALVAMPARIGELAKPYLINRKTGIRMSAAMGTVFIERVLDSLTILLIFFVVLFFVPLPAWLVRSSLIFLLVTLLVLVWMLLLILKREASLKVFERVSAIFPKKFHLRLNELIHHFIGGIGMITDMRLILYACLISLLIWTLDAAAIYVLFLAFGMNLSVAAALIVMVVLIIGITLPTAPGFVGTWHFFCIAGLTLFGISKPDALSYAIVLHFISIGITIVLGLIFLPFNGFRFSDLSNRQK